MLDWDEETGTLQFPCAGETRYVEAIYTLPNGCKTKKYLKVRFDTETEKWIIVPD